MPERHLRAIDGAGELQKDVAWLPSDVALLIEDHKRVLRENAALRGRITRLLKEDPQRELVESLLAYWKARCRGPLSRCEIPVDGRRGDMVRKTLKRLIEHDEDPELANRDKEKRATALAGAESRAADAIREAIDGAAAFPFRDKYGRVAAGEPAPGLYRASDLTDILRDERTLEKFRSLHDGDARRRAYAHDLKRRMDGSPKLRDVLASLQPEYPELLARAIRYCQGQP